MTPHRLCQHALSTILALALCFVASACGHGNGTFSGPPSGANEWTWIGGSETWNSPSIYGTKGTAAPSNTPGARELSSSWTDAAGNFWLFGGNTGVNTGTAYVSESNDLWKYDRSTNEWMWSGGSNTSNQLGLYGTQGAASPFNIPGAREAATCWMDASGNFWLFGGIAFDSAGLDAADINDLWEFSPASGTWTWEGGSDLNALSVAAKGVYGIQGIPNPANVPGARDSAAGWADSNGNLWLFGGYGYDSSGDYGGLNDLWEYTPRANTWTWISGGNTVFGLGAYGTQGVPASTNLPQARERMASWIDNTGDLWLFGGIGWSLNTVGMLNDLWRFDPVTKMWTWEAGSNTLNAIGAYGTKGVPASSSVPGGRERAIAWVGGSGNLWLYGGLAYGGSNYGDLWVYNPSTAEWTRANGSNTPNVGSVYGTEGVPSSSSFPGARTDAAHWTDQLGDLWLFGGGQQDTNGTRLLGDLWRYQPQ